MFRRRHTLATQLLELQLLIVVAVLVCVTALSLAQSSASFQREEGRRALSAAESLAANPAVRELLPQAQTRLRSGLQGSVDSVRAISGVTYVSLADADGSVVISTRPGDVGIDARQTEDRSWTGLVDTPSGKAVEAHVPILGSEGAITGTAIVGIEYPSIWTRLLQSAPNLLVYLAVASLLGGVGSILLARRVKRQTLGMEAGEILDLVRQREAMLRGLKEGVIAFDAQGKVVLMSDSAHQLLDIPRGSAGRSVRDLGLDDRLQSVLTSGTTESDQLVLVGDRLLVLNTVLIESKGRTIGSVTTFRDRTELRSVEEELDVTKTSTDALRAHIHEFDNQLHTISGLIQLGEYDEVVGYVEGLTMERAQVSATVTEKIADVGTAALVIAKIGAAAQGLVTVELAADTHLEPVDRRLGRDLVTVVGNLVDNAVDAVGEMPEAARRKVRLSIRGRGTAVEVRVEDAGPGIAPENRDRVFGQGWSTKGQSSDGHGFGLALVRLTCRRRGGDVTVSTRSAEDIEWTVFSAVLHDGEGA
ncbi:histidine kinase [Rhodococcus sp. MH15]|nr:histidine kinase [Rhodococcus erythropolis]KSU72044.1 histidine kinase [Rhodococcus qingshengii]MBW0289864.1 histidine kinase [Rhodococcus sp. MH15]